MLRYWEREFRSIRPTKSAKGQRVYSRKDVENLLRVRDLLYRDGFTIAGAKKRLQRGARARGRDRPSPSSTATARPARRRSARAASRRRRRTREPAAPTAEADAEADESVARRARERPRSSSDRRGPGQARPRSALRSRRFLDELEEPRRASSGWLLRRRVAADAAARLVEAAPEIAAAADRRRVAARSHAVAARCARPTRERDAARRLRRDADPRVGRRHAPVRRGDAPSRSHGRLASSAWSASRRARARCRPFRSRPSGRPRARPRRHRAHLRGLRTTHDVVTCFAACATPRRDDVADCAARACDASVLGARLEGSLPSPAPGLALGARHVGGASSRPATAMGRSALVVRARRSLDRCPPTKATLANLRHDFLGSHPGTPVVLEGRPTWSSAATGFDRRCAPRRRRRARIRGPRPRRLAQPSGEPPAAPAGSAGQPPAPPPAQPEPLAATARDDLDPAGLPPARPARWRPQVDPAGDQAKLLKQGSERPDRTTAPSARVRRRSTARTGGRTRGPSSSCTATSARAASSFTTSRSAATRRGQRRPEPLAAAARQQLHAAERPAPPGACSAATERGQSSECYDKTQSTREPPPPPQSRDSHLGQPADHVADRPARQPRARVDAGRVRDEAARERHRQRQRRTATRRVNGYNGYAPLGAFSTTQGPPTAGVNGYRNSIDVTARVGRVPHAASARSASAACRATGVSACSSTPATASTATTRRTSTASCSCRASSRWTSTSAAPGTSSRRGPTNASPYDVYGGQPYNTCEPRERQPVGRVRRAPHEPRAPAPQARAQRRRRQRRHLRRLPLAAPRRDGGSDTRSPPIDTASTRTTASSAAAPRRSSPTSGSSSSGNKLRIEAELATIWGSVENSPASANVATRSSSASGVSPRRPSIRAVEDKLRVQFGVGWASGDPNVEGLEPGAERPPGRARAKARSRPSGSTPSYQVDYIFFRQHHDARRRARTTSARASSTTSSATRTVRSSAAARRSSGAARASSSRRPATSATSASSSTSRSTTRRRTAR